MVPIIGVEPTTFALRMRCSTNLAISALKGHVHERESRWTRLKLTGRCVNGLVNQMATFASPGFIYARMV